MNLRDKVIVITGAGKGLGRALVEICVKEDAKVMAADIAAQLSGRAIARPDSNEVFAVQADVSDEDQVKNLAQTAVQKFGRIDIWVNNAGIWIPHGPVEETSAERARKLINVNFLGTLFGCQEALKQMKRQGEGTIVNVISIRAKDPRAGEVAYTASKFAADGLTKALREELRSANIAVLGVYPGGMQTNLFEEKMPENYKEYMPPEDVAQKIIENLKNDSPQDELIIKRN